MTPRKRKATAKASDTGSPRLDAPPAKRVKPESSIPSKRPSAPRAAKVNRNDPDWLVTNKNSPLVNEDLYAEFCDPMTYENFTREDWDDLRESLPPNVPFDPIDGSISLDFFKYDPDFRRGIREFQEDLAAGRLDPAWQAAAVEAMEERARGDFDAHKENQFEEFWGQKQKLDWQALAGDSAKLKLDVMIHNGMFKVGDSFSYSRVSGRGKSKVLVEKECPIVRVGADSLTFAIPPGRLKYARRTAEAGTQASKKVAEEALMVNGNENRVVPPDSAVKHDGRSEGETKKEDAYPTKTQMDEVEAATERHALREKTAEKGRSEGSKTTSMKLDSVNNEANTRSEGNVAPVEDKEVGQGPSKPDPDAGQVFEGAILSEITNLAHLETKILEIDGRLNLTEVRASINAWKTFRGKRDNQDLGTLFEMREEFYVWKHPQIPKRPRSGPSGLRHLQSAYFLTNNTVQKPNAWVFYRVPGTNTTVQFAVSNQPIAKANMARTILQTRKSLDEFIDLYPAMKDMPLNPLEDPYESDPEWEGCYLGVKAYPIDQPKHLTYGIILDLLQGLWNYLYRGNRFFATLYDVRDDQWGVVGVGKIQEVPIVLGTEAPVRNVTQA